MDPSSGSSFSRGKQASGAGGGSRKAAKKSAQGCMQPLVAAERPVRACKLFPPKRRSLKQAKGRGERRKRGAELRAPEQTIATPLMEGGSQALKRGG